MSSFQFLRITLVIFAVSISTPVKAAVLQINDAGILTGATGVDIRGVLYDVQFVDGTCGELFDGCNERSDLLFDEESAEDAAEALFFQVFDATPISVFDQFPNLTQGCEESLFNNPCAILIPGLIGLELLRARALVNTRDQTDRGDNFISLFTAEGFNVAELNTAFSSGGLVNATWGVFSLSEVSEVPLPAAPALLISGLAMLFGIRRRSPKLSHY